MLLDLNDPGSIVRWYDVFPERHGALLTDWSQRRPEHRAAIARACRLIQADPTRAGWLRAQRLNSAVTEASGYRPCHDEVASGEPEH